MQEIIPSYLQRIVEQIVVGISAWEKIRRDNHIFHDIFAIIHIAIS